MHILFKVVLLLDFLHYYSSDGAYMTPLGNILPCITRPCTDYGIVITPRGNYSTLKLSVYKFNLKNGTLLRPSDVEKIKTNPNEVPVDFDRIFNRTKSMASSMLPLIKAAKKAIPEDFQLSTPIFFSIDERTKALNQEAWSMVIGDVVLLFANKTVPFLTGPYSVMDNTDFEEASYKWLLVNFLLENFSGHKKTVATLSFNGKMETEISYEKNAIDKSVTVISTIQGESHAIVTSTFLKKGSTHALYRYFDAISSPKADVVKSPCGLKGLKKQFKGIHSAKWIVGTGDIQECRKVIRENVLSICDEINGCPNLKNKINGKIYAFPNVAATMKELGFKECTREFTPTMLDDAIKRVCGAKTVPAKTGAFAKREKRTKQSPRGIIDCVNGNFLYLMLTEAYHLSKNAKIHANNSKIAGLELDPSLGELLIKMELL